MKLKIPYGISNYEEIISKDYYNVYKTRFIERLEEFPAKYKCSCVQANLEKHY